MKTLFIINPVSGKGRPRIHEKTIRQIKKQFMRAGIEHEIAIWKEQSGLDQMISYAIENGFQSIVAAGGDGTINEIAQRLVGTGIALGVIPLGSGNGLARHLGYSRNPAIAVRQLVNAHPVVADSGDFGGKPFMNNAGIGIDAEVAKRFSKAGKRGIKTYVRLGMKLFFNFKAFDCKLIVDGITYDMKSLMLMDISNGTQWGGGAKIAPESRITDGYLEAILVERSSVFDMARMLGMLFDGTIHRHPKVKVIRGKQFTIERSTPGNAHVDGESIRLGKTITAGVREQSLNILVPGKRKTV